MRQASTIRRASASEVKTCSLRHSSRIRPLKLSTKAFCDEPFYADRLMGFNGSYAVNHPVQGSCAEVMQIALVRLDKALRPEPTQLIATVHDEVVMLVPDDADAVGRIGGIAQREMVAAFVEVFPNAPTIRLVEPKVGPTWGDLKSMEAWLTHKQSTV